MLEQAPVNKMQKKGNTKATDEVVTVTEQAFFYPDYQITINAPTQAEADLKLAKVLEDK